MQYCQSKIISIENKYNEFTFQFEALFYVLLDVKRPIMIHFDFDKNQIRKSCDNLYTEEGLPLLKRHTQRQSVDVRVQVFRQGS